jgi:hypothetical protein
VTLSPKVGMWFSIILAVVGAAAGCGAEFTTIFGQHVADQILAGDTFLLAIGTGVNAVLHMIPSVPGAAGAAQFPLGPKS